MIDDIEYEVRALGEREVKSRKIGNIIMKKLKDLDEIAYIRFASVYRCFADLGDLAKEVIAEQQFKIDNLENTISWSESY